MRRTRKEKESPHHHFEISWQPEAEKTGFEPIVKSQFKNQDFGLNQKDKPAKKANSMAKAVEIEPIKKDIIKTLILASLILGTEMVIYFILF